MTDENLNVSSQSVEPTQPAAQSKPDKRGTGFWQRFWWVPLSFTIPFVVIYICLGSAAHLNLGSCFRSGTIGLIVGAGILLLWTVDQKIQNEKSSKPAGVMIGLLGIGLWLGWVVAAHVMVLANDEAYYREYSDIGSQ